MVYVAFTLKGNIGSIYVNGALVLNSTLSTINSVTRSANFIGRNTYGNIKINAINDEIKIFQVAISASTIQTDFTYSGNNFFSKQPIGKQSRIKIS